MKTNKTGQWILIACVLVGVLGIITYKFWHPKEDQFFEAQSWRGITPGQTTKKQVLALLGEPNETGVLDGDTYFLYKVPGPNPASHRIFFHYKMFRGMVVSWMDVARGVDRNNLYYIHQALRDYGPIDTATRRYFGDHTNPEKLYVWANQGVAFVAIHPGFLGIMEPPELLSSTDLYMLNISQGQIKQRYAIKDEDGYINYSSPYDVVIRAIFFPPMEFDEFWSKYGLRIPYAPAMAGDFFFVEP